MTVGVSNKRLEYLLEHCEFFSLEFNQLVGDLLSARRERDEAKEELASESRWRDTYQLKVIELERQLAAANKALEWVIDVAFTVKAFACVDSARAAEGEKTCDAR